MSKHKYNLIIPVGMKPKPDQFEEQVAEILAGYFKSDIKFITRISTTTPDILVVKFGQQWEIKNIRGNSPRTIQNNLRKAEKQSKYVAISLFRTEMTERQAISRINNSIKVGKLKIKRLILITKTPKLIVIK